MPLTPRLGDLMEFAYRVPIILVGDVDVLDFEEQALLSGMALLVSSLTVWSGLIDL